MIKAKRWSVLGLIFMLAAPPAFGISVAPPQPFTLLSADKAYIFVSIPPDYSDVKRESDEHRAIRESYKVGGVYQNDGSREPLWEFRGELYYEEAVIYFDDRSLVLAFEPHESTASGLIFFDQGQEIRRYKLNRLTYDTAYLDRLNGTYDAAAFSLGESWYTSMTVKEGTLRIINREQNVLLFDVKTGKRNLLQEGPQSCILWFNRVFGSSDAESAR